MPDHPVPDPVTPLTAAGQALYSLVTNEASVLDYEGVAVRIRAIEQEAAVLAHPSDAAGEGLIVTLAGYDRVPVDDAMDDLNRGYVMGYNRAIETARQDAARATRDETALDVEYDACERTHAPGTTHYHPLRPRARLSEPTDPA